MVQSLALLSELGIQHCYELQCRSQAQLGSQVAELLWLWCRPASTGPIQPLPWELPHMAGEALKKDPPTPKKELNIYIHTHTHI